MRLVLSRWIVLAMLAGCTRGEGQAAPIDAVSTSTPPDATEWNAHLAAASAADRIADAVERCRAYPDLPGNAWPAGSAQAHCGRLAGASPTRAEIESMLAAEDGAARPRPVRPRHPVRDRSAHDGISFRFQSGSTTRLPRKSTSQACGGLAMYFQHATGDLQWASTHG